MQCLVFARLPDRRVHHHIAFTRMTRGERTVLHTQDFPELFLVTRGSGVHWWNGRAHRLERGSFAFVRARERHCYEASGEGPLEFVNLALAPAWWRHFSQLFSPPLEPPSNGRSRLRRPSGFPADAVKRIEERLHTLLACSKHEPSLLAGTMMALAREWLPPAAAAKGATKPVPEWLATVVRDMENPQLVAKPLAYWQHRSGRSPEHLARSCRRFFGRSLTGLLNRARVEWIKSQLRRGDAKIALLALDAGYQNLGYFYRVFRQLEGNTPGAWAKNQGESATVPR
jgi:AraC family cel operon transcriptional repressor